MPQRMLQSRLIFDNDHKTMIPIMRTKYAPKVTANHKVKRKTTLQRANEKLAPKKNMVFGPPIPEDVILANKDVPTKQAYMQAALDQMNFAVGFNATALSSTEMDRFMKLIDMGY